MTWYISIKFDNSCFEESPDQDLTLTAEIMHHFLYY